MGSGWKLVLLLAALTFSAASFGQDALDSRLPAPDATGFAALPPLALTAGNYDSTAATGEAKLGDLRLDALPASGSAAGPARLVLAAGDSGGSSSNYVETKLGAIWFEDDLEDLDVGFLAEVAFGRRLLPFLGVEFFGGYVWGEETGGTVEGELWGIPFGVNAKVFIPIPIVEPYAGVGIGGWWLNIEADTPLGDVDEDDLVFGGQVFLGAHVKLGPVLVGVEGRYIQTDEADTFDDDIALKGWAALASAALEF